MQRVQRHFQLSGLTSISDMGHEPRQWLAHWRQRVPTHNPRLWLAPTEDKESQLIRFYGLTFISHVSFKGWIHKIPPRRAHEKKCLPRRERPQDSRHDIQSRTNILKQKWTPSPPCSLLYNTIDGLCFFPFIFLEKP